MFINPKIAITNGWIKGDIEDKNIQPNAIDFTLDKLFTIARHQIFAINETSKKMRGGKEMEPKVNGFDYDKEQMYGSPFWVLERRTTYDGMSNMYVELPEGVACMLIVRSTFNRNGIFITSGLYDSRFKGHIGFAIHNNSGHAHIEQGTRIGQIIFVSSDSASTYDGGWNHEEDTHYLEK